MNLSVELDRSDPVPLYFQVARQIEAAIVEGRLRPGARLDNELVLAEQLRLSRLTIRRAIQHLVDKGLLVRKRGVGTQVVHGQVKRAATLTSLYDDLVKSGQQPTTQVLKIDLVPAPAEVADALGISEGRQVLALERLRSTQDGPLAIMRNWLPASLAELTTEQLEQRGLFQLLRSNGVHLRVASQQIGASNATTAEARLLGENRGAALLTMVRTTYDDVGRAVEYGRDSYRASRYTFEMTLVDR
ncbi:GntR family transcriptional regulator [Phytoactinopolyspora limicola]|uniref:GntR family transcriptional regulator n=1 Tax=Phytoactinopolyspora limicola TaxID=2715536 RepID=UPI00140CCF6C|nr:GntR family transcriptional regulator [Phytoactinopolyspora limicola]